MPIERKKDISINLYFFFFYGIWIDQIDVYLKLLRIVQVDDMPDHVITLAHR